jgi:hypothetical protein
MIRGSCIERVSDIRDDIADRVHQLVRELDHEAALGRFSTASASCVSNAVGVGEGGVYQ